MNTSEERYNALIQKMKTTIPELRDANALTNDILEAIQKENARKPRIIVLLRPVLTAAAIFLFGLYLYQQTEPDPVQKNFLPANPPQAILTDKNLDCLIQGDTGEKRHDNLFNKYLCYLKHHQSDKMKSKQFLWSQISRFQKTNSLTFN